MLALSIHTLGSANEFAAPEMLVHVEQLGALGTVIVTDYAEGYQLVHRLCRYTTEPILY